ncbi:hypothetical protein CQ020_18305, partial [Arthrobacter sp. MYb23]
MRAYEYGRCKENHKSCHACSPPLKGFFMALDRRKLLHASGLAAAAAVVAPFAP